jgi:hypothetical protein
MKEQEMTICPMAVRNVNPSFKSALDVQKVHLLISDPISFEWNSGTVTPVL